MATGFEVEKWNGIRKLQCSDCPWDVLDDLGTADEQMNLHRSQTHPSVRQTRSAASSTETKGKE